MERRTPPRTKEGWYILHDFRTVDWDAWRAAPDHVRERALEEGRAFLADCEAVDDAEDGDSAMFAMLGHETDLLFMHIRPTMADVEQVGRRFDQTAFAEFTERADSYVSVAEVSDYVTEAYFEEDEEVENAGLKRYLDQKLYPQIPDAEYVNFYPMEKRRQPEFNWYDLPFDQRSEHMSSHGDIGRSYGGKVSQITAGSIGFDDYEWSVSLFANDPANIKNLLAEMRFDPSTSKYAEFGRFYVGCRFDPHDLEAYMAGEAVPAEDDDSSETGGHPHAEGHAEDADEHSHGHGDGDAGGPPSSVAGDDVRGELEEMGVYAGKPHGEDVHAVVLYSEADPAELFEEVDGLRTNFDHYDTHVMTAVYEPEHDEEAETAVVSLWETDRAANTAAGFLSELPGVVRQAGDDGDSWGTMGMFYTVKPDYREDFVGTFEEVGGLLADMDGHRKSNLLINREDENDMFIASRWDSREDAMAFFRSDAFSDTVEYGRDVLADRPRHVFLA
ncbi:heme-binding protein [Natrarchaeobaculum sulfurireducens]|uniref:Chlorite dismutase n=1 Tax=Natrarchaeobaculum sulfurireducens TaxID=2044521 RepID=A0A346PLM4_9EURY|nr:heme-binding protein [Natrarchaeobaculum sulfurireducens]AXR76748.1 Chlorite dismutase [Natrarchaeobaculum sulfurireducens]AXR80419.1 Chlorite dismutase [Natrarchaeobaculum sulfurireducens]